MRDRVRSAAIAGLLLAAGIPSAVWAHHTFAMFDFTRELHVTGAVKKWDWVNPHVWLTVVDPVTMKEYAFEGGPPLALRREGLGRDFIKVGDQVTVDYHPNKDGSPGGKLDKINRLNAGSAEHDGPSGTASAPGGL